MRGVSDDGMCWDHDLFAVRTVVGHREGWHYAHRVTSRDLKNAAADGLD
jgi:hypothetical protein